MILEAGVRVRVRGHVSHIVKMYYIWKCSLFPGKYQPNSGYSNYDQRRFNLYISSIPGLGIVMLRRGHISHIVKMYNFFENFLLFSKAEIRQTKWIVTMTKERSSKYLNFITLWPGVLVLGCGHISHIVFYQYTAHWFTLLRDYNAAFLCHCCFSFILW